MFYDKKQEIFVFCFLCSLLFMERKNKIVLQVRYPAPAGGMIYLVHNITIRTTIPAVRSVRTLKEQEASKAAESKHEEYNNADTP